MFRGSKKHIYDTCNWAVGQCFKVKMQKTHGKLSLTKIKLKKIDLSFQHGN